MMRRLESIAIVGLGAGVEHQGVRPTLRRKPDALRAAEIVPAIAAVAGESFGNLPVIQIQVRGLIKIESCKGIPSTFCPGCPPNVLIWCLPTRLITFNCSRIYGVPT